MKYKTNQTLIRVLLFFIISIFSFCKKNNGPVITEPDGPYPQYGTPFSNVPASQDAIIYQVNIRAFPNANFKGVLSRIDSIKALGVNVLYLMPVYPVGVLKALGGFGSPFCVKDYKGVNTEFGTLEDLRKLVDAAHERNMSVMLDWVANHTSWDNGWITSHKNWYTQDSNGNIVSPEYWGDVADLDYSSQDMRLAMIDAMKYWVYTANIDGFRCDAADFVPYDFWKQANDALKTIKTHKLLMLAEGTRADHLKAGFQLFYGVDFYAGLKTKIFGNAGPATLLQVLNTNEYLSAVPGSQVVRYITNHDLYVSDGSPVNVFGGKNASMSAFLVTALMKGVPMIYNGQEVGCTQSLEFYYHTPIDWTTNPDMTAEYKKILNFRKSSNAIRNGQIADYSSNDVAVFTKTADAEKVLVIANLRGTAVTYTVPAALPSAWKNAFTGGTLVTLGSQLTLQPYQHMVLTL